jgi:hypothetical protein
MAEYNITCVDCGGPYTARRSDAKKCASCRLLGILTWSAKKFGKRKCRACKAVFKPWRAADQLCADCDTAAQKPGIPAVTCVICRKDAPMFERCPVCAHCVKSPARQPVVLRALQKGRAYRRKHGHN